MNTAGQREPADVVVEMFFATDRRAWDTVRDSFTDTVRLDYTSLTGGEPVMIAADDMVEAWKGVLPGFDATHHHVTPVTTTPSAEEARVILNGTATHRLASAHGESLWTIGGYYEVDLVTGVDGWKIARFTFVATWGSGNRDLARLAQERVGGPSS
jgi:SnoaL-like domain